MFGRKKEEPTVYEDITDGLKGIYKKTLLPLEKVNLTISPPYLSSDITIKIHEHNFQEYNFHEIEHAPMLEDPDFDCKPLLMVMGQYSTGKTTFIR